MATDDQDDWDAEQWQNYLLGYQFDCPEDEYQRGNPYSYDWEVISNGYKSSVGYICEICGVNLTLNKQLLHTHHITNNKSNNESWNLQALCVLCHSNQVGHEFMKEKILEKDRQLILEPRKNKEL